MIGTTLGHYRIVRALGRGGMGEVWAAEDTKLQRVVALKLLPPSTAADPERLARFRREAQAIAALNHPRVVTIYSVEEADGKHFITMELVDGQTLAERIPPRGFSLHDLLKIAVPLVDAVTSAHAKGVVHRDLKPANVMIGPPDRLKVLDFGLAKLRQDAGGLTATTWSTGLVTAPDDVFGTPAYMSPEQAEGRLVDHRTDVFSLGIVLYEMATGKRPFQGESSVAILWSILKETPAPLADLRPDLPADLDRILRRCLAKDPERRYQTALDLRNELEDLQQRTSAALPAAAGTGVRKLGPATVALGLAAAAVVAVGVYAWATWRTQPEGAEAPVVATFAQLTSQPAAELFSSLSPDGRWIVYAGEGAGNRDIYLQSTSGQTPINLTADSPADDEQPAFSPDGELIAFRSSRDGGGIFVMGRTGEAVRRVTRAGFNPSWSPDGKQIALTAVRTELKPQNAEQRGPLMVVAVGGGEPRKLYDSAMLPSWSPHGTRLAFSTGFGTTPGTSNIATMAATGGEVVFVTQDGFLNWNPIWAPDGNHLYFVSNRGGSMNIWRVALDEASGRPRSEPEAITSPAAFAAHLSISADGRRLAYSAVLESQNIERVRFDPERGEIAGAPTAVTTGTRFWANPDPSPDGDWLVFYSQNTPEGDLYIGRSDGAGALRQLTSDAALDRVPRWSPDGAWITMFSDRTGDLQVWAVRPDGSDLRQVTRTSSSVVAWAPDGRSIAVSRQKRPAAIVDIRGEEHGITELPAPPPPHSPFAPNSWSPDGRRIAGMNGFTTMGIAVYSFDTRAFDRVTDFGEWPVWLPDSQRILFVSRGRELHLLDMRTRTARMIFSVRRDTLGPPRLTRDGRAAHFSRRVTEADVWLVNLQ